jgi:hypothetical protein
MPKSYPKSLIKKHAQCEKIIILLIIGQLIALSKYQIKKQKIVNFMNAVKWEVKVGDHNIGC